MIFLSLKSPWRSNMIKQTRHSKQKNNHQINKFRLKIRKSGYLLSSMDSQEHKSIDGTTILNTQLVGFQELEKSNVNCYCKACQVDETVNLPILPVKTEEEEAINSIKNLTKKNCNKNIQNTWSVIARVVCKQARNLWKDNKMKE